MKRYHVALGGALAFVLCHGAGTATAQFPYPSPFNRPVVSPYVNLARPGPAAINYYGLVRPQLDFRSSMQNLQGQVTTLEQQQALLAQSEYSADIAPTGVQRAQFMTHLYYFNNALRPPGYGAGYPGTARQQQVGTAAGSPRAPSGRGR
jgi:hypothetical protein